MEKFKNKLNNNTFLRLEGISKNFLNVKALNKVNLEINKGEIHAIVGENGAGKTTLISIISGVYRQDDGDIYINGKKNNFKSVSESKKSGISTVHQELSLVPNLSVAENIFAERAPSNKIGIINRKKMNLEAKKLLNIFKIDLDVTKTVGTLDIGTRQIIEIVKAISINAKLIILDEPTSSLDLEEKNELFEFLVNLKKGGISIIYISHFIDEVFEIADKVTILRDGSLVGSRLISELKESEVIRLMTGKFFADIYTEKTQDGEEFYKDKELVLKLEEISYKSLLKNISFDLYKGEVLGICGLVGSGRTELLQIIYGLKNKSKGKIFFKGKEIKNLTVQKMKSNGIGYICEDRKTVGLFLEMMVCENIYSVNRNLLSRNGFIDNKKLTNFTNEAVKKFNIKAHSIREKAINLSGGNQQKLLIAMWLMENPLVMLVDEPTRGIDVGAKADIHNIIKSYAYEGNSVILVSSEFSELISMANRIIVINKGEKVKELVNKGIEEETLVEYASGLNL